MRTVTFTAKCGHDLVLEMDGDIIKRATLSAFPNLQYRALRVLLDQPVVYHCTCIHLWELVFPKRFANSVDAYAKAYNDHVGVDLRQVAGHLNRKRIRGQREVYESDSLFLWWFRKEAQRRYFPDDKYQLIDRGGGMIDLQVSEDDQVHKGPTTQLFLVDAARTASVYLPIWCQRHQLPFVVVRIGGDGMLVFGTPLRGTATQLFELGVKTSKFADRPGTRQILWVQCSYVLTRSWLQDHLDRKEEAYDWHRYFQGRIVRSWMC